MASGPAVTTELIPFEHITLTRGSGYLVDGYIYTRKLDQKDRTMIRCQERKCHAKGYISRGHAVITNDAHTHPAPDVRAIRFRAQLREAVGEERNIGLSVPEVYNQVKWNFMQQAVTLEQREELEAALPSRSAVERAMHRRRSDVMPQAIPTRQANRKNRTSNTVTMQTPLGNMIPPTDLKATVQAWLKEDIPSFDYGGYVVGEKPERAVLLGKSAGVLAGVPFFNAVFEELGCTVQWNHQEGSRVEPVCALATVKGKACSILQGERTALNCIARASGVATMAKCLTELAAQFNWRGRIAGTRKTTPGFRVAEKYGLLVGGVDTHRYDLSSMIMLKDNHIWSAGSITDAVHNAKKVGGFSTKIEVECRNKEDAVEAATAGADVVMLDNFEAEAAHGLAQELRQRFPRLLIEASGGITTDNISTYFGPNIDIISMSKLTQGYGTVDFSLKIQKEGVDPSNPTVAVDS